MEGCLVVDLGVAGARHVLALEGYRWIAPLSAFYPNAVQEVDLSAWHTSFPRSSVVADEDPTSRSRLRPDYVALRSKDDGSYEWAIVESKGTKAYLSSKTTCPRAWTSQVRNVQVVVNGSVISIPRHLVIATRINPNAKRPSARCIQLRAWNRKAESNDDLAGLPGGALTDIVSAHLFGLFHRLKLRENAIAIALSVQSRNEARQSGPEEPRRRRLHNRLQQCDEEIQQRAGTPPKREDGLTSHSFPVETDRGTINVEVIEPVLELARKLQLTDSDDEALVALNEADGKLNDWERPMRTRQRESNDVWLPFGVEIRFPASFRSH